MKIAIAFIVAARLAASSPAEPELSQCTPDALFADAREGLASGSPALRRYLRSLLVEAALVMPNDELRRRFEREDDPAMIEALGAALAQKAQSTDDPSLVQGVLARAVQDGDPARRAAAVRALRATGSVELMAANGGDVDYARLIKDGAAEVRDAVVDNLIAEDREVYSGHSQELSEASLEAAFAAEDGALTAKLLGAVSTQEVGKEAGRALARALDDDEALVRAASARALGGLSPKTAGEDTVAMLVARYRSDDDLAVRRAILESIARLQRQRAIPVLLSLRPVDPRLQPEIDAWVAVLQRGLPEWSLILRELGRPSQQPAEERP